MIREFKHKGLERFFTRDDRRGCPAQHIARIGRILDRLNAAANPKDMDLPGYRFHRLRGNRAKTHSVTMSGNLRITFEWDGEDDVRVNLEDYH